MVDAVSIPDFAAQLAALVRNTELTEEQLAAELATLWGTTENIVLLFQQMQAVIDVKSTILTSLQAAMNLKGAVASVSALPADAADRDAYQLVSVADPADGHLFVRIAGSWTDTGPYRGPKGRSAYEVAVANGYTGSELEFAQDPINKAVLAATAAEEADAVRAATDEVRVATDLARAETLAAKAEAETVVAGAATILAAVPVAEGARDTALLAQSGAEAARADVEDVRNVVGRTLETATGYLRLEGDALGNLVSGLRENGVSHLLELEVGGTLTSSPAGLARTGDGPLRVYGPAGFQPAPGVTITSKDLTGTPWADAREVDCDAVGWVIRVVYSDGRIVSTETPGESSTASIEQLWVTMTPNSNNPPPNGGSTLTGLDKFEAPAPWAYCVITGNDGRSPGSSTFYSGLLLLSPDYRVKLRELQFGPTGGTDFPGIQSIQWVAIDTTDWTVWFCDKTNKKARHIALTNTAPYYTKLTDEITAPVSPNTGLQITLNCGCYYPPADALMLMNEGRAELLLVSCADGSVLRTWQNNGLRADFDQMNYDPSSGYCAFSYGANGADGKVAIWDPEGNGGAGALLHTFTVPLQAIEGVWMRLAEGRLEAVMDGSFHDNAKPPLALAWGFKVTL